VIVPQNTDVLIKPLKRKKEKTNSGIYLAGGQEMQEESLRFGEIVHPGESEFKKGDKVIYSAYSGAWITDDDGEYQLLNVFDIRGLEK